MANREFVNDIGPITTIGPVTANADVTGVSVDLLGYDAATLYLSVGIGGITFDNTNRVDFVLQHSDDNSSWAAVTQDDVKFPATGGAVTVTNGIIRSLIAAKAAIDAAPTRVGYVGTRRYLRLFADFSGTHATGTPINAAIHRGHPIVSPV